MTISVGGTGTATSGTDYAAVTNFDLTISKGQTSGTATFTLTPTDDTLVEGNETIGVAGTATGLTVNGADLTLTDDDAAAVVNLSLNPSSVGEGDSAKTVTVTAAFSNTNTYTAAKTVTVTVGGSGTATSGTDYTAVSNFDVTIDAGKTSGTATFTLTPTQDTLVEGNETIGVAGSATGLTVNKADLTLTDDDAAPEVNFSLNPSSVSEGASGTSVTVTATFSNSSTYGADKKVTVSVGGSGTATSGTDYAAVSNFDVTITKGKTIGTATFTLTPTQDTLIEGNETIGVAGSTAGLTVNGSTLTLTDDDDIPAVNLSLNPASVGEGASETTVTVTAAFNNSSTYGADKKVTVTVGKTGTATSGTDYTTVSSFDVTIDAGKTSGTATFALTPTQDTLVEGNETIGVAGSVSGLTVNGTEMTLTDDDNAALSIGAAAGTEGDEAVVFTVTLTPAGTATVSVSYATVDGTAVAGQDFTATSGRLTFAAGETSRTVAVPLIDDDIEEDEAFTVVLDSPANAVVDVAEGAGTISDNDEPTVSVLGTTVVENAGDAVFTITFDRPALVPITLEFATEDGTATAGPASDSGGLTFGDPGAPAGDYVAEEGQVTFAPGQTMRLVSVPVVDDQEVEPTESFTLRVHLAGDPERAQAAGPGTIEDDDLSALTISETTVLESDGTADVTVTLEPASPRPVTVWFRTEPRTATAGADYEETRGRLSFAPGDTERTISVPVLQDALVEPEETFVVALRNPEGAVLARGGESLNRILDDEGGERARRGDEQEPVSAGALGGVGGGGGRHGGRGGDERAALRPLGAARQSDGVGPGRRRRRRPDPHGRHRDGGDADGPGHGGRGGRQGLNAGGDLALKVDAFHATLTSEAQQGLAASSGTATRVRTLVEKEFDWSLSESSVLRPSVEAGVRWDGGSDVTGAGGEVGGGVEYKHAGLGLSLEATGRYLVAHQADGFDEWGAGLALRFGPGVGASGPWVSLEPTWGNAFSQVQGVWDPQASPMLTPGQRAQGGPDRVATTAGYRFGDAGDVQVMLTRDRRGGGPEPDASLGLQLQGTLQWGAADGAEGSAGGG